MANCVAEWFIAEQLDAQLKAARSATAWLREQPNDLQVRVRDAEAAVEMMRAELTQAAGQGAQVTAQQLQVFVGALASARAQRSALEIRLDLVTQAMEAEHDVGVVPEFQEAPIMREYRQRMNALRDQEVALRAVRTADVVEQRVLEARIGRIEDVLQSPRFRSGVHLE